MPSWQNRAARRRCSRDPKPAAAVCLLAGTRWRHPRKDADQLAKSDRLIERSRAVPASEPQQPAQPPRDDVAAYHAAGARVSACATSHCANLRSHIGGVSARYPNSGIISSAMAVAASSSTAYARGSSARFSSPTFRSRQTLRRLCISTISARSVGRLRRAARAGLSRDDRDGAPRIIAGGGSGKRKTATSGVPS